MYMKSIDSFILTSGNNWDSCIQTRGCYQSKQIIFLNPGVMIFAILVDSFLVIIIILSSDLCLDVEKILKEIKKFH